MNSNFAASVGAVLASAEQPLFKIDGRTGNGGARPGAGRKPSQQKSKQKNTTVCVDPVIVFKARSRHGSLAKALAYAANNGGKV